MKNRYFLTTILIISFIIILVMILTNNIIQFDNKIYDTIFSIRNDFFDTFFKTITTFGNTINILCITVLLLILLSKKDRNILGVTVLITVLLNQAVKYIIQRTRPNHVSLIRQGGYSFPSGHAMISIAVYGFLIYFVNKKIKNKYLKYLTIILLLLLILGIGCSRIYLGVHYPSDVLAGYILSLIILIIVTNKFNQDEESAISQSIMLEIERIRKKGILFCVCTNGTYQEVLEYNKDFPFIDYIISLNGSYIYDVLKEQCIAKKKIAISNIKKISTIFEGYNILYYTENNIYEEAQEAEKKDIYKIEVEIEKEEEREKLSKLNINSSIFIKKDKMYLEIVSGKNSMFSGVDQIGLKNNFALKDVIAVCANESDYSLVTNIPYSYVIKDSCKKLEKATRRKISKNPKEGIEIFLKKI